MGFAQLPMATAIEQRLPASKVRGVLGPFRCSVGLQPIRHCSALWQIAPQAIGAARVVAESTLPRRQQSVFLSDFHRSSAYRNTGMLHQTGRVHRVTKPSIAIQAFIEGSLSKAQDASIQRRQIDLAIGRCHAIPCRQGTQLDTIFDFAREAIDR